MFLLLIGLVLGLALGCIFTTIISMSHAIGTLRLDNSDEEPYLFLEVPTVPSANFLEKKKYITLKVDVRDYVSQK